ncbi:hypothetical protein M3202_11520 [Alkalihalobacillus oceani]|uniref:Uncharacterized protein n=1 Tax=Halalkalibacter oceani TaxID=1653776 RepID=A0A9X2DQS8_9BACI|nr:hypothetical protein [Halalkalibacter oceani]MCM3714707.1 hypothetical protein [Halalkalibacter oceani]
MLNKFQMLIKKETGTQVEEMSKQDEYQQESSMEAEESESERDRKEEEDSGALFHVSSSIKNSSKEIMNLIVAVEQVAHQYQLTEHKLNQEQDRTRHLSDQLEEQRKEINRLQRTINQKNDNIAVLETKITDKNLKFDQLAEDYNELKSHLTNEIDELKNIITVEQKKFAALNEQYENEMVDWLNKVKQREDRIVALESENTNLIERNDQIKKENRYLLKMVKDFTSRMSAPFLDYENEADER